MEPPSLQGFHFTERPVDVGRGSTVMMAGSVGGG